MKHTRPADIEQTSMGIIEAECRERGIELSEETAAIVKRVIHTTADFDYAENLQFTEHAVERAIEAMKNKPVIITDTNMTKAGVSKITLAKLEGQVDCLVAEVEVVAAAKERGCTRSTAAMEIAASRYPQGIFAVGNAPTALFALADQMKRGIRPSLVIAVPVGFVNVVEAKEEIFTLCKEMDVPAIMARGRKGGSNVSAAILNALLYLTTDTVNPEKRGW